VADEFDRASELEQAHRDAAVARALAPHPMALRAVLCAHCEEFVRAPGSLNCARCDLELAHEA